MSEMTLNVSDIHCGHCKTSIEGAVAGIEGVDHVEVAIEARTVDVRFADTVTRAVIVAAIEEQGYEVG